MIERDLFNQKLKKAGLLTGYSVEKNVADALYDELSREEKTDFLLALRDLAHAGERINLFNINRHLNEHKSYRLEKEAEKRKREEENTIKDLLIKEGIPEEVKKFLKGFRKK